MVAPFMPDDEKIAAVREALPAVAAGVYLNTGSVGPLPAETAAAMSEVAARELAVGRAHPDDLVDALARIDEARAAFAAVLTADVDDIALTHSTTDGMNVAAWSIDWRRGDRAVTTREEHPGGIGGLYGVRDRLGVELAFVDTSASTGDDALVEAFDAAVVPGTRLVSISHVLWTSGARLPVERVVALAHERGALVAVDGAQAAGAIPVDVGVIGADFYAVSAQKWLLGPEGIGALHVARAAAEQVQPAFGGWHAFERVDSAGTAVRRRDARRFQYSNFHRPSVVGAARSCGWLSMYVGLDWVHERGPRLARLAADRLGSVDGVELITPVERMATLVSFRVAGWPAEAVLEELGARVFAIARVVPAADAVRLSVGCFNTEEEIERVVECVRLIAAHTTQTIPPVRRLSVLG